MFLSVRKFRKYKLLQLLTTFFALSILNIFWEELDQHVVSHVKSYSYRHLINSYSFINKSFLLSQKEASNVNTYPYLINHKEKCRNQDVLLLLFVKSSPRNVGRRRSIRSTWGNEIYVWRSLGVRVKVVFALGVHEEPQHRGQVQQQLVKENRRYKDLVQQDFADTFHNLTIKLILQFHWAYTYCRQAEFLMLADDDIFIHMPNLVSYVRDLSQRGVRDLWVGRVHRGAPPIRHKNSKYYVPYEMYPWVSYPDYTAGAGYLVSRDVAGRIHQATMTLNTTLHIDDVFMGICASVVGVSPQEHAYFSGEGKAPYHPCIYDKMMTSHGHVTDVRHLWKAATNCDVRQDSAGIMGRLYCIAVKIMLLCKPYSTYSCMAAFS